MATSGLIDQVYIDIEPSLLHGNVPLKGAIRLAQKKYIPICGS